MKTCVKICGITNSEDARVVAGSGADFLGVIVDIQESPRSVSVHAAQTITDCSPLPVILLLEKDRSHIKDAVALIKPYGIQLIGDYPLEEITRLKEETGCFIWKTVRVPKKQLEETTFDILLSTITKHHAAGVDTMVLDTMVAKQKGGTGQVCDWKTAEKLVAACPVPVFLAGGITPGNVQAAITQVKPYGIDLSSGVEKTPGKKSLEKITKLMHNIKLLGTQSTMQRA